MLKFKLYCEIVFVDATWHFKGFKCDSQFTSSMLTGGVAESAEILFLCVYFQ